MSAEMTLPSSSNDRLMFWASVRVKPVAGYRRETYTSIKPAKAANSFEHITSSCQLLCAAAQSLGTARKGLSWPV